MKMQKIITNEQKAKIVTLANQGYSNRQIAIKCSMKHSTLCYWKAKIREQGIVLLSQQGRPKQPNTKPTYICTIAEFEKMTKEDREFIAKQELKRITK